jgi:hypothetical protein
MSNTQSLERVQVVDVQSRITKLHVTNTKINEHYWAAYMLQILKSVRETYHRTEETIALFTDYEEIQPRPSMDRLN